jgi:vancomycin resistance protein YoaR
MRGGKLTEILPGKAGNVVDIKKTTQKVEQLVLSVQKSFTETNDLWRALASLQTQITADKPTGTITVPVETVRAEPKVTRRTVDEYDIRELVGFAKTNFAGSSDDRRHNIEVGVSKLTGILLAPGEEFSAVVGIGTTTEEEGFVPEFVIKESKSVKELGGGLCQLATTLFRLALDAGLPITERVNHRYVVGYYGPGLDATIYGPHPDLKFINDTNNYLLLQGRVEGTELIFELYGQKDGRAAEISEVVLSEEKPAPETKYALGPDIPLGKIECSETPRKGITADATYIVRYANGEIKTQDFHSVYQPWQKICLIGTKGL